jgi:hypothetical protein
MFFCPITDKKCSTSATEANSSSMPNALTISNGYPLPGIAFGRSGSNLLAWHHTAWSRCLCTQKLNGVLVNVDLYSMRHFFMCLLTCASVVGARSSRVSPRLSFQSLFDEAVPSRPIAYNLLPVFSTVVLIVRLLQFLKVCC